MGINPNSDINIWQYAHTVIMSRWGKTYKDKRNWKEYNEELVIRGKFFFDFDFVDQWDSELEKMNLGKRGSQFLFP